jgi:PKD repeat protein
MGETDFRRGARWLALTVAALGLAAAAALAAPPQGNFTVTPNTPNQGEPALFTCKPCPGKTDVEWDLDGVPGFEASGPTANTTFATAGSHTVSMRLTRNGETNTITKTVTVNAAADAGPTSSFTFAPPVPDVGETVSFTSTSQASQGAITDIDWDFDGNDDFADFTGSPALWAFDTPGTHVVKLRATQTNGLTAVGQASVRVNGIPSADFTWNPASPVAGASVNLVSTSTDFEGPLATFSWDLDGDGLFGDGSGPVFRQPFAAAGTYDIGLQVTDSDGTVSTVRRQIVVARATLPSEPTGTTGSSPPAKPRPRLMNPFPVVRIAGTVLPHGALINVLSVRAPRGAQIRLRCVGDGCPVGSVATTSATRLVRFRRFERRLRAGIRLKVFVRQANRIGKYTSFLIRAGAPPKRVDLCVFPTRRSPGRCP